MATQSIFFIFIPKIGEDFHPFWLPYIIFSKGVGSTTKLEEILEIFVFGDFDFTTKLATDLEIIFVGDIGEELA